MKLSVYFENGTTLELSCTNVSVDPNIRCLMATDENGATFIVNMEHVKYWKTVKTEERLIRQ